MADKSISELVSATTVQSSDLFVLQQNNTAKKLDGQTLINFLLNQIDGHGGIQSVQKVQTSGLVDTYRITFADSEYTVDFTVTNGKGITGISKTGTAGLVDTYKISYNDGSSTTFTVTNGAKGDKGDNAYLWYKFASEQPTSSSSSMGDEPDAWMGVYSGHEATAPTDPMSYTWVRVLGNTGLTGDPATLIRSTVEYQVGTSGTVVPSGNWSESIPTVPQGNYLWTRTTIQFNTGGIIQSYTNGRNGLDGLGSVVSVNNVSPGENGNVELTADDVGAVPKSGGTMEGPLHMNGQTMDGLNDPTGDTEAARKAYVDKSAREASPVNLLDNSDFRYPVAQAGIGGNHGNQSYAADRWILTSGSVSHTAGVGLTLNGTITQKLEHPPAGAVCAFVGMASGQASISYSDGAVTITSSGGVIAWAALYEGEYTAGVLPNYHPKGYWNELSECQRHYLRWGTYQKLGLVAAGSSTAGIGYIFMPRMRVNPTISFDNMTVGSDARPITSLTISTMSPNMIEVSVHATGMTAGNLYALRPASDGYCEFIADKE